ncbi:hypothetical protein Tsubulata_000872 [Turnera subulata]|uniref:Uncharacterized protein n=1 Tax=Turnera subulata TaxID=218843 RepID=A0A9Q0G6U2_9ROSI|nr:hypothetical protein Tsubulata_000872 [Turnera subulata]
MDICFRGDFQLIPSSLHLASSERGRAMVHHRPPVESDRGMRLEARRRSGKPYNSSSFLSRVLSFDFRLKSIGRYVLVAGALRVYSGNEWKPCVWRGTREFMNVKPKDSRIMTDNDLSVGESRRGVRNWLIHGNLPGTHESAR